MALVEDEKSYGVPVVVIVVVSAMSESIWGVFFLLAIDPMVAGYVVTVGSGRSCNPSVESKVGIGGRDEPVLAVV